MSAPGIFRPPTPTNEPVKEYAPGSPEREQLRRRLDQMQAERIELPLVIGGEDVTTGKTAEIVMPHRKSHVLADANQGGQAEVDKAIRAAADAWADWSRLPWEERAAVFLRAAELLSGPWRATLNAATMLGQSKTAHQAEIDAACEVIDFYRFNVEFMTRIYEQQPVSSQGVWNRMEYRPLEGFVLRRLAVQLHRDRRQPAGERRADGQHRRLEAGRNRVLLGALPDAAPAGGRPPAGVINLVYGAGATIGDAALASQRPRRRPLHRLDRRLQRDVEDDRLERRRNYRNYPRIVGETGGKDFIVAHPSADVDAVATAIVRGSFEYQGQKCSAASRVYAPANLWPELRERLAEEVAQIKMGDVADFENFMGAVIDAKSFETQKEAIDEARADDAIEVLVGGGVDDERGLLRRADRDRDPRPGLPPAAGRAVRAGRDRVRLSGGQVERHARARRRDGAVRR